jgi:methyl-accepting chemotaxis protein
MRISVKSSLIAAVAILLGFLLVEGWVGASRLGMMRAASADLSGNWMPSTRVLGEIKYTVTRHRVQMSRMVLNDDEEILKTMEGRLDNTLKALATLSTKYEGMIVNDEERRSWAEFKQVWAGYLDAQRKIQDLARKNVDADATKAFNESTPHFDKVVAALEAGIQINDKGGADATAFASDVYDGAIRIVLILVGAAAMVGVGAGVFVVAGVTRPLDRLTASMSAVAAGDLASEIPSTARGDEIGAMARALVVFRDGLAEAKRLRAEQLEKEAEVARRMVAERHRIADAFMNTMGALAGGFVTSSSEVADAARNLSATAEETSRQAAAVTHAAETASVNVETVAASTEELTSSVQEITGQVVNSAKVAETAAQEAAHTEANIRVLSDSAEKIGDVVNLIKDIAGQTNLLALNATIEAARAGEAGRGFAVVASEVKLLAAQTAKATDEIALKIGEIQTATSETVASIDRIVQTIGTIRQVTGSIAGAVEQQGAATREISSNTHRAADGTRHVTDNISGVGHAAEMTGAAATQLMGLSTSLTSEADRLTREVNSFVEKLRAG